jgi:hypothetical protein
VRWNGERYCRQTLVVYWHEGSTRYALREARFHSVLRIETGLLLPAEDC